jgi:hypothetical protein
MRLTTLTLIVTLAVSILLALLVADTPPAG